jgi:hypothetical protein
VSDEKKIKKMKKQHYLFRESGEDEGDVARLTTREYRKIQSRLDKMFGDDIEAAFYISP